MKRCNQCFQTFSDDYSFCLNDGTTLVDIPDMASQPTIIGISPTVFTVPATSQNLANTRQSFNPAYAIIGLLTLIVIGLIAFLLIRESKNPVVVKNENSNVVSNTPSNTNEQRSNLEQEKINQEKENLQLQKDKIELEKQKLNREKAKLEQQKTTVQPSSSSSIGYVSKPPSNVRESPNGTVLCKITYKTSINIYGSTNVRDNNGEWYYTDVCGKTGVIHSTQFNF